MAFFFNRGVKFLVNRKTPFTLRLSTLKWIMKRTLRDFDRVKGIPVPSSRRILGIGCCPIVSFILMRGEEKGEKGGGKVHAPRVINEDIKVPFVLTKLFDSLCASL